MSAIATLEKPKQKRSHVEHRLEVDGVSVRYIEAGQDKPGLPVVLLHGFQAGADLWFPYTFPAIAEQYHVYALDLPGFGQSGQLREYGVEAFGRFLNDFLDKLGLDAIQLVGHSMGGQITIATATQNPERVKRLMLIASAGLPRSGPRWAAPVVMLADRSTFDVALYPQIIRLMLQARATKPCLKMLREESVYPLLSKITMPTLVLWGSRDRVVPLEHAILFTRNITGAKLTIMRGCGHRPFYQKPEKFNKIMFGFLKPD
jgi:pimeloyl-ACP methyl ester carboxylesterase